MGEKEKLSLWGRINRKIPILAMSFSGILGFIIGLVVYYLVNPYIVL